MTASAAKAAGSKHPSLAVIVSHPLRRRCWSRLAEGTASPKQLADELHEDLSNVSYHVEVLLKAGAIEPVRTEQVRGAVAHYYRSIERPMLEQEETEKLSLAEQTENARHICQLMFADAAQALDAQTFCSLPEHAVCRTPLNLDAAGCREIGEIYAEMAHRILQAQANSDERVARQGGEVPTTAMASSLLFFETANRDRPN